VSNPRLKIPSSRPTLIFERVCQTLQSSVKLRCVKAWRVGGPSEKDPDTDPNSDQCPFVRLYLDGVDGGGARDNISQDGRLVIGVDVWCRGFAQADVVDLFSRIVDVVFPAGQPDEATYRTDLQALGAKSTSVQIVRWASPTPLKEQGLQVGKGQLGIQFRIQG
jgi:hypothetical protein